MKYLTSVILSIFALFFFSATSFSQLVYSQVSDVNTLITNIFGVHCEGVSNVQIVGSPLQIARFENGYSLGVSSGLVLSTGIANMSGFPSSQFSSANLYQPGDPDILLYGNITGSGSASIDAIAVKFDFTPLVSDTIRFNYIFASEEYPEYANSAYSDRFLFLVSENGGTPVNIAHVPGTNIPVEINTINDYVNGQYYVNNMPGIGPNYMDFVFDAYTVPLEAKFYAQVGSTYHIKLVISDVADGIFDSAIFLDEQDSYNTISGDLTVDNLPAQGVLEVFNYVQDVVLATPVKTVSVTNGSYAVDSLPTGMYHVRFTPDPVLFPNAIPLYFASGSSWTTADAIGLPCYLNSANISLDTLDVLSGNGSISGTIVIDTSYLKSLNVPFEGALVILKDAFSNETKGFTYSQTDGSYLFSGVADGSYYILLDVPYIPHTDTLFIDVINGANLVYADYAILSDGIEINGDPEQLELNEAKLVEWSLYPNPAKEQLVIRSNGVIEFVEVISIDGITQSVIENTGKGSVMNMNVATLSQGVYFLRVNDGNTKRLVISRN